MAGLVGLFLFSIPLLVLYFLPALIATKRQHPNHIPIFIVNLFFGWTLLGWVAALAWALTALPQQLRAQQLTPADVIPRRPSSFYPN